MDPLEYITVVRRRWRLVVACAVVALAVGWVLMPAPTPQSTNRSSLYEASVALITPVSDEGRGANVSLVALVSTSGDVPRMAAEKLGYTGDPDALAQTITATPDPEAGTVQIVATGSSAEQASATAVAFAESATAFLRDAAQRARHESLAAIQGQLDAITQRVNELDREIVVASGSQAELLTQQKSQELERYGVAYAEARELAVPVPETAGLQSVGAPNVTKTGGGIAPPSSVPGRLLLFGGLGLLLGALVAIVVDRLDTRLRNRSHVEEAFNLPVIAEVPKIRNRLARASAPVITRDPGSLVAEAYRSLRSTLSLLAGFAAQEEGAELAEQRQVLLVTSALTRDGKSTTVANLAAAFAEAGRSVLVLDCDFRNPQVPDLLDAQPGIGLSEVLATDPANDLQHLIRPTAIAGVSVVGSGAASEHPATLLLKIGAVIEAARELADVVLIDSAPLLSTNDTTELMPYVDATLVVCRAGRTKSEQARRVTSLLARTGVPVLGVAFVGVSGPSRLSAEYRISGSFLRRPRSNRHLIATAVGQPAPEQPVAVQRRPASQRTGLFEPETAKLSPIEGIEWITPPQSQPGSSGPRRRDGHDSGGG
jgi:capsular exopolysaccharide synthesis family protein